MLFSKEWFQNHQKLLLWLCNTLLVRTWFRWILRINGNKSSVGKRKILRILPNAITWFERYKIDRRFKNPHDARLLLLSTEFRTHNKFAKRLYYAFKPIWYLIHFWDTLFANNWQPQWNLGFDTLTTYPNDNVETTSVDGFVEQSYTLGSGAAWATIRGAAGSGNTDSGETAAGYGPIYFQADNVSNQYIYIVRGIYLFDTSALGAGATVSAATESIYGSAKSDALTATPDSNIYASTPASNTDLANGDYAQIGVAAYCDTAITYAGFSTSAYNDYAFNATGLAAISLTGITKTGYRNVNRDVANSAPTWASSAVAELRAKFADTAGTTEDPKLVITYTPAAATGGRKGFAYFL